MMTGKEGAELARNQDRDALSRQSMGSILSSATLWTQGVSDCRRPEAVKRLVATERCYGEL